MNKILKLSDKVLNLLLVLGYINIAFWLCLALFYFLPREQGLVWVAAGAGFNGFFCIFYIQRILFDKREAEEKQIAIRALARLARAYRRLVGESDNPILDFAEHVARKYSNKD